MRLGTCAYDNGILYDGVAMPLVFPLIGKFGEEFRCLGTEVSWPGSLQKFCLGSRSCSWTKHTRVL